MGGAGSHWRARTRPLRRALSRGLVPRAAHAHRDGGDLFPLPVGPDSGAGPALGTRSERRRLQRKSRDYASHRETAIALNRLCGWHDPAAWPEEANCKAQASAISRIQTLTARRSWPKGSTVSPRAAVDKLLRKSTSSYATESEATGALSSFQAGHVSLPKDKGGCNLADVLQPSESELLSNFETFLLRTPSGRADLLDDGETVGLYTDPAFSNPLIYAISLEN